MCDGPLPRLRGSASAARAQGDCVRFCYQRSAQGERNAWTKTRFCSHRQPCDIVKPTSPPTKARVRGTTRGFVLLSSRSSVNCALYICKSLLYDDANSDRYVGSEAYIGPQGEIREEQRSKKCCVTRTRRRGRLCEPSVA